MPKENELYSVYSPDCEASFDVRYDDKWGGTPLDAAYEAAEYFWKLADGRIPSPFTLVVTNIATKEVRTYTSAVEMEPHFNIT